MRLCNERCQAKNCTKERQSTEKVGNQRLTPPGPARSHVFLLGFPRSGTTLLEAALTGSPEVIALEEQEALVDGVRRYLRDPTDHARILPVLRERLGDAPMVVLDAPVCRPGWLIEIEGLATIPTSQPDLPPY